MGTFVVTYSLVWFVLVVYVARLGNRQRQLLRDAKALQVEMDSFKDVVKQRPEKAA